MRSHVLNHLKPNTEYSVFIVPFTSQAALSRPSSLKLFQTKEDGKSHNFIKTFQQQHSTNLVTISVPDFAPTNLKLQLLNSSSAVVTWTRPSLDNLHGDLTGYKMEIFTNNTLVTNFTLEPSAQSLMLNNITSGVIYSVRLATFNRLES